MPGSQISKRQSSPSREGRPETLDLSQFASLEEAMVKVAPGDRYLEIGKLLIPLDDRGMPMTLMTMFWFSMITRSQGLHAAIAREISEQNPHAVFPLIRAFAGLRSFSSFTSTTIRTTSTSLRRDRASCRRMGRSARASKR